MVFVLLDLEKSNSGHFDEMSTLLTSSPNVPRH